MTAHDRIRLTDQLTERLREPPEPLPLPGACRKGPVSASGAVPRDLLGRSGSGHASRRENVGTVTVAAEPPDPVRRPCEHVFCSMIVCVLLPRFELAVAAGGRDALPAGPRALPPEGGRESLIGETSAAAEAHGVRAGLRLGEPLARCPTLRLVTP